MANEKKAAAPGSGSPKARAISVYLSSKDRDSLEEIARKNNINRHMLLSYAVRYFLANYRLGTVKLDPTIEKGKVVLHVSMDLADREA